ncbi:hypothetical protein TTHERM_00557970 (macronuclear) [Tetrahymena thermophila SB210]|uniref:Transmembrane protein n=1 Tax=Tetrahymena thermophila (strain SB210) TaxID=312017 RepID=I7M9M4_TETTS|nr:hypothetical protein TTHERM_00557970 [Tetrahymena thermophila SB210]EAS02116.1 hypothetical protein TTHERM_00557970 [Tetrahymena thermophila SB210]|eukprot:XP_001022361.1 hypothetical protein TTHERM_00557970 [Tetrahymena thermophila SB210]
MKFQAIFILILIGLCSIKADATTSSVSFISSFISSQPNPCGSDASCAASITMYALCLGACATGSTLPSFQSCASSCTSNNSASTSFINAVNAQIAKATTS